MYDHNFRIIYCATCGHTLRVPIYCKNRFCPTCSTSRTIRIRARINSLLSSTVETRSLSLKMLTLSIPSSPCGGTMLKNLLASFRALRRRKLWRSTVRGGVFVVEATVSERGYHLHIHAVVFGAFIPWDALKADWEAITGATGVYIQKIPRKAAVGYLTKYLTKPGEDPETLRELSGELKGARFFQPFGDWHNCLKPEKKIPYKCPKCGDVNWLPEEYFLGARNDRGGWRSPCSRSPGG